jgi:hypothetical protein
MWKFTYNNRQQKPSDGKSSQTANKWNVGLTITQQKVLKMSTKVNNKCMAMSSFIYIPVFCVWNTPFNWFLQIMQIRHVLVKDHL